ncbi:hypothetical protein K461DRAFT_316000 [Myriangium duriaei CBS 260.36]|uniref:Cytochrome b561 domain-containing protein n=1 Tax=Myriangium duriaei CBS 260.36 TaxID=1168546 RepID=A0A9P4ISX6_9PEZI|nr:hypothetical protein K461DRAFT_316000 [Myriangium duriaei CBS 260.36]
MLDLHRFLTVVSAHGLLAILTFVIIFPAGVLVRILDLPNSRKIHGYVQTLGLVCLTCVLCMGVWQAKQVKIKLTEYHPAIGLTVWSLVFLQYCGGFAHYLLWRRDKRHNILGTIHENIGRTVLLMGLTNGALGLHFAKKLGKGPQIAYGICAITVVVAYIGITYFKGPYRRQWRSETIKEMRRKHVLSRELGETLAQQGVHHGSVTHGSVGHGPVEIITVKAFDK